MNLNLEDVHYSYSNGTEVLKGISFNISGGDLVSVLGPNGVGKSTLFRCILGFLPTYSGTISIDGKSLKDMSRKELSHLIAYVPQSSEPVFEYTVKELVLMGMTNRLSIGGSPSKQDEEHVMDVLEQLRIADLAQCSCTQISGGQRQLALLARALVQDAQILIMDEPTANLDYGNQYRVLERISNLGEQGYCVIMSTHDPNQAYLHSNRALVIQDGHILADGAPQKVMTEELLSELYGIRVGVSEAFYSERKLSYCFPLGYND